jgi:hypothetical protein
MADYLSVAEAAAELDLSPAAVRALIKKDELPGAFQNPSRIWVIPEESVKNYRAKHKKQAKPAKKPAKSTKDKKPTTAKRPRRSRKSKSDQGFGWDDLLPILEQLMGGKSGRTDAQKEALRKITEIAQKGGKLNLKKVRAILSAAGIQLPKLVEDAAEIAENPAQGLTALVLAALKKDDSKAEEKP